MVDVASVQRKVDGLAAYVAPAILDGMEPLGEDNIFLAGQTVQILGCHDSDLPIAVSSFANAVENNIANIQRQGKKNRAGQGERKERRLCVGMY